MSVELAQFSAGDYFEFEQSKSNSSLENRNEEINEEKSVILQE